MEYLVLKNDSWMDDPARAKRVQELIDTEIGFEDKYQQRYQKGDIIEEGPDGHWSSRELSAKENEAFILIKCPQKIETGMGKELQRLDILTGEMITVKRRKYNLNTDGIVGNVLTEAEFDLRLQEKQL